MSCLPNFQRDLANRVFVDIMNEPDSMQIKWEADGAKPGAHQLYLGTADALWDLTPDAVMFFFEGEWSVCTYQERPQHASAKQVCMDSEYGHVFAALVPLPQYTWLVGCCCCCCCWPPSLVVTTCSAHRHRPEHVWPQLGQRVHH